MPRRVIVYFDYLCPFSWRLGELVAMIEDDIDLIFEWRHFSMFQHDHDTRRQLLGGNGKPGWQLWNDKIADNDGSGCKGLLPFLASQAARRQGPDAFKRFRLGLQRAAHRDYLPLHRETIVAVAVSADLHLPTFLDDLDNPESRTVLAQEHMGAVAADVVNTPTVVFPGTHVAHVKLQQLPLDTAEAVSLFQDTRRLLERYPFLYAVTRPIGKGN